jgi:hypothetical protein
MRVLLDECLPRKLARELIGHECKTTPQMGWAGLKNGALLVQAAGQFDVFLTVDKRLPDQQKLANYDIAVVVLRCMTNDINDLKKLLPELLIVLPKARKRAAVLVG